MKITIELETIDELRELMAVKVKEEPGTPLDRFLQEIERGEPVPGPWSVPTAEPIAETSVKPRKPQKNVGDIICTVCGKQFTGRIDSKYCSSKCYHKVYDKMRKPKKAIETDDARYQNNLEKCKKDMKQTVARPEHHHLSHSA